MGGRSVLVSYAVFVLVGLGAGVTGVLLLAQMAGYGVDRATIGLTFLTGSVGFFLASMSSGPLIHRLGNRAVVMVGGAVFVLAELATATRPAFAAFVLLQLAVGYGTGILESVLNVYLTQLPDATTKLNRLHAFFGVGALAGPLLATWMLTFTTWPWVVVALAALGVPLMVGTWLTFPGRAADPLTATTTKTETETETEAARAGRGDGLLMAALRRPAVLLGASLLAVYVGLELGVGNWGYGYLVDGHALAAWAAGSTMSGYWLGLTLGRFVLSPVATRFGLTAVGLMYLSLGGVTVAALLAWLAPAAAVVSVAFGVLGFFLGPVFPTTIAVAPRLTEPRLVPTAIGVLNAGSVVGGSALPWLAGAVSQGLGPATLLPFAVFLAVVQLAVWWRMATHLVPAASAAPPVGQPAV